MIWRDDDVGRSASPAHLSNLAAVDDVLQAAGLTHTVAVIAKDLERQPELVAVLLERRMDVQLHCWAHDDLTESVQARTDLGRATDVLERLCGRRPTVLYPPWNRTNDRVEEWAATIGLRVSHRKVSLEQFIRAGGDVREDAINFHYWDEHERDLLPEAVRVHLEECRRMKITDYCPRAAPFDTYLTGRGLVGVEVGVDAGAHAEALLRHCDIALLTLVDVWPKDYQYGFCVGRLSALGFRPRFRILSKTSMQAAQDFAAGTLDFVYIDQEHDGSIVADDLSAWWPLLKRSGVLGYRNYSSTPSPLKDAVDAFVAAHAGELEAHVEAGEIILRRR